MNRTSQRERGRSSEPQSLDCAAPQVSAAKLAACKELAVGFATLTYGGNRNLPVAALKTPTFIKSTVNGYKKTSAVEYLWGNADQKNQREANHHRSRTN
jgi:hypothetical protein